MIVVAGLDAQVQEWAKARGYNFVPPFTTLALMDGERIAMAAVFNVFQASDISLSIVSDGTPVPASRAHMRALFQYPFIQLKLNRISVRTRADALPVRKLIRRLGFKPEGKHPAFYGPVAAISYGMLRRDCKWL